MLDAAYIYVSSAWKQQSITMKGVSKIVPKAYFVISRTFFFNTYTSNSEKLYIYPVYSLKSALRIKTIETLFEVLIWLVIWILNRIY